MQKDGVLRSVSCEDLDIPDELGSPVRRLCTASNGLLRIFGDNSIIIGRGKGYLVG